MSLLSPTQLKERFPWVNADGVVLASYGECRYNITCTNVHKTSTEANVLHVFAPQPSLFVLQYVFIIFTETVHFYQICFNLLFVNMFCNLWCNPLSPFRRELHLANCSSAFMFVLIIHSLYRMKLTAHLHLDFFYMNFLIIVISYLYCRTDKHLPPRFGE